VPVRHAGRTDTPAEAPHRRSRACRTVSGSTIWFVRYEISSRIADFDVCDQRDIGCDYYAGDIDWVEIEAR
jgi:hypothetical protein